MLAGKSTSRNLKVRGYVGMPALLSRFLTDEEYRNFFLAIRLELHARGFATYTLYFEKHDITSTFVTTALKQQKVDSAIWLLPGGLSFDTGLRLQDKAIRFLGVATAESPEAGCRYQVRRADAITALLRCWRADKVESVTVVRVADESRSHEKRLNRLRMLAKAQQLSCDVFTAIDGRLAPLLASSAATGHVVVIPGLAASMLSCRVPDALAELLRTCRVALIDGPVSFPFAEVPPVLADIVTIDWKLAAKRIATDLLQGPDLRSLGMVTFEAEHRLQVPLRENSRTT